MDLKAKLVELQLQADLADNVSENTTQHREFTADCLIAHGVTVQEWISVKDRLPDQMGKYLCRYVFGNEEEYPFEQVLWYYTAVEKPHFQHEGSMGMRVTHWMPLPQPPKGK